MVTTTSLAQHILLLEPDKDAARLCLYDYLKNLCDPSEWVDNDLLGRFFKRVLTFPHWQQNRAHLFGEIEAILSHYSETHRQPLDLAFVHQASRWQAIAVENIDDLQQMVQRHLEKQASHLEQYRVIPDRNRIIALVLGADRSLRVMVYNQWATIRHGELVPLCEDFILHYTPELVLSPNHVQQAEVGNHISVRFRFNQEGCRGILIRGYTFQKYAVMDGGSLHRYPMLFYPLKRLEQFFINRKSDPMYVELTSILEKAAELLQAGHPEGGKFAAAALERGKLALEHIFPDDKMVRLLINNLEKTYLLEGQKYIGTAETNSDPLCPEICPENNLLNP